MSQRIRSSRHLDISLLKAIRISNVGVESDFSI